MCVSAAARVVHSYLTVNTRLWQNMLKAIYFIKSKAEGREAAGSGNREPAEKSFQKPFQDPFQVSSRIPSQIPFLTAESERAVQIFRSEGFGSGILEMEEGEASPRLPEGVEPEDVLFLCDDGSLLRRLREGGLYAAGYLHSGNAGEKFPGADYIIQEPDLVDPDSYVKIYEREAGLPWTILRTPRLLVREFTEDDLDSIYSLYDEQAGRFLEPPGEDRDHERAVLKAYIERIYRLYGFGHWAVIAAGDCGPVSSGSVIGRIGFSAITADQEREAAGLGITGLDADFGFLLARQCRGRGIAFEACSALLRYGFEELGFVRVRADAREENEASLRLLGRLGFTEAGRISGRRIFFYEKLCKKYT